METFLLHSLCKDLPYVYTGTKLCNLDNPFINTYAGAVKNRQRMQYNLKWSSLVFIKRDYQDVGSSPLEIDFAFNNQATAK
ncbi:hypothetical protein VNO77_23131 [Canavalia gladiata]|uniref:Uncharacterized protein n=1 Tax=Canavalia gladiata TaxID=3824 RepID=A0AAN9L953_CANGL